MQCPHCLEAFHEKWEMNGIGEDADGAWFIRWTTCPTCNRFVVTLWMQGKLGAREFMARPRGVSRAPLSKDVPEKFAKDYREACLVLGDSSNASAALSRRCLQHLLRAQPGVQPGDLFNEIEAVIPTLPSHLQQAVDGVRVIGNFASHPMKSTNTGEILDVIPEEAEWLLDTLEGLFDFYFVQPATSKKKRDATNAKLVAAGKKPMKERVPDASGGAP